MRENKKRTLNEATKKRIAKAMKGNKNAEVWTDKLVIEVLNKMCDVLEEGYEIQLDVTEENKETSGKIVVDEDGESETESKGYSKKKVRKVVRKVHLKHDLLVMFGIRNSKWFTRMKEKAIDKKFEDNETVLHLLDYIHDTCMSNTYNDAANGATNSTIAKMNLSTHHQWSDRVDSKVQHDGKVEFEKPEIPPHLIEAYERAKNYTDASEEDS